MNTRSTKTWWGLAAVLPAVGVLTLWAGGPAVTAARADGIPDAGAQMQQLIEEQKATNARLDRLITLLSEGKVEVTLRKPDDAGRNR